MKTNPYVVALGAACLACSVAMTQDKPYLPVGSPAPEISGTGTDGKDYSLKSLTSNKKPLFVVFWKEQCPHNPRASALFNNLNKAYEGKAKLIGVVTASADGAKKWVERFQLNFPLLADANRAIVGSYKLGFSITSFQIGADGKVVNVFEGYGADELKSLNKAMADAAGVPVKDVDLSVAPGRQTWG